MTEGGDGMKNPSDDVRKRLSETHKGIIPWCKGKKMTEEQIKNMRGPRPSIAGENNPRFGTHPTAWNKGLTNIYSEETKHKISTSLKEYFNSNPKQGVNTGKHRVYREDGTFYLTK